MADEQTEDRFAADADPADGGVEIDTVQIDTTVAHPARVYDYWLGGYFL